MAYFRANSGGGGGVKIKEGTLTNVQTSTGTTVGCDFTPKSVWIYVYRTASANALGHLDPDKNINYAIWNTTITQASPYIVISGKTVTFKSINSAWNTNTFYYTIIGE